MKVTGSGTMPYTHPSVMKLSEAKIREESRRTENLIAECLTEHKLFRPPYGSHNQLVDAILKELDYHMMLDLGGIASRVRS